MAINTILKRIFNKKEEKISSPSLIEEINKHVSLLVEKSKNLNENFEEEKTEILEIAKEAANIKESKEILAAKLEQDILGRITATSSACESGIAGKVNINIKKEISLLKAKLSQRSALK